MSYVMDSLGIEDVETSVGSENYLNKLYRGPKQRVKDIKWKNVVKDSIKAIEGFNASMLGYLPGDVGFNFVKVQDRNK